MKDVLALLKPVISKSTGLIAGFFFGTVSLNAAKIVPSVILASIEGEVHSFSLEDEFKVTLDSSSVGKKFSQKSILSTGKDGKAGLLFSNGALITIKPGSRFYLRKYNQKIVTNAALTNPSKMEEEPSNSELLAHLDFGELIVKAPKLNKGSTMVLSSPLGTARIRGTMFQMMAVRNPLTGDISGGVNLISGDIDFTDTSGNLVSLVSGQSIVAASSKLGESIGSQSGGLVDLSSTFGPALSGSGMPPAMDSLFPPEAAGDGEGSSEESSSSDFASSPLSAGGAGGGWEMVHELASAVFFEIEESESSSSNISFESMQMAVTLDTPSPQLSSPTAPAILTGGSDSPITPDPFQGANPNMQLVEEDYLKVELTYKTWATPTDNVDPADNSQFVMDPWIQVSDFLGNDLSGIAKLTTPRPDLTNPGIYPLEYEVTDLRGMQTSINRTVEVTVTPPQLFLNAGKHEITGNDAFEYLVKKKYSNYPVSDDGPFQFLSQLSDVYPHYEAKFYDGTDLTPYVQVIENVDYNQLGEYEITLSVNDFSLRKANLPSGNPVTTTMVKKINVIDDLPPISSVLEGSSREVPYRVEGVLGSTFVDPGIEILDNYYSQDEIEQNLGFKTGSVESAFGNVNMDVAGVYEVIYQGIKDPSGNEAVPLSRFVEVYDDTPPELMIYGADPLFVDVNNSNSLFRDPGAFAFDNLDGAIDWESGKITVSMQTYNDDGELENTESTVDEIVAVAKTQASLNKSFQMVYSYIDYAGNEGTTTRQIILMNSPFDNPEISITGENPLVIDVGTEFQEPGYFAFKSFGGGLEPKNFTSSVSANQYVGNELGAIDFSIVNFTYIHDQNGTFIDPNGNPDLNYRSTIKYYVQDDFGNEDTKIREIQVVDRIGPLITLSLGSEGGKNFSYLQAGIPFTDPGYTVSDNYDSNVSVIMKLIYVDTKEELNFDTVATIGFTDIGTYEIQYSAVDANGNLASENGQSDIVRTIEVIDTLKPQIALITHDFLRNPSLTLTSENDPPELENTPIIDASNPVPDDIISSLSVLKGWDGNDFNPDIALTLTSNNDFYVLATEDEIKFENHPSSVVESKDDNGRYRYRMSGFFIEQNEEIIFEDPGIYVRNDSDVSLNFSSTLTPVYKPTDSNVILSYKVNYYASQDITGEANQLIAARNIFIIDQEKPLITASPVTDGVDKFIIIEANREPTSSDRYTDLHGDGVKLYYPNASPPADIGTGFYLELSAYDVLDGVLTSNIVRTVKDENGTSFEIASNTDQNSVATNIATIIDSTVLDRKYTVEYYVNDIPIDDSITPNKSDIVTRHLIVKDTQPPVIDVTELNSTFMVDFLSESNPDVNDAKSVATYLLTGISATDANDYDQELGVAGNVGNNLLPTTQEPDLGNWVLELDGAGYVQSATYNSKWKVEFSPAFIPGAIYPEIKNANAGYEVLVSVQDQSGNESQKIVRYLQVGDFTAPTLTLIGKYEIHDFMRFKSNSNSNLNQTTYLSGQSYPSGTAGDDNLNAPFLDRPFSLDENPEYNATGFNGGEHRMLLADYNFVDPGVYAEDQNAYFDIKDNYPDLDGDGVGEGHAIIRVDERQLMNDCTEGPGTIHIYSFFEKNSYTVNDWQELMGSDNYGFNTALLPTDANATGSPAKVPDVDGEHSGGGHSFTDANKSDLTNFDMTTITIEYRVMDGWENKSEIITRMVYLYESRQYGSYAFYATPITDAAGGAFEQYYDNNTTSAFGDSNPFLTSARKDLDGDGVSDFWEFALGTNFKDPNDVPDMSKAATFQALSAASIDGDPVLELQSRLSKLYDASALPGVRGLGDFNATLGL